MANVRITDLPDTLASMGTNDVIAVEDVANNTTKKITKDGIRESLAEATVEVKGLMSATDKANHDAIVTAQGTYLTKADNLSSLTDKPAALATIGGAKQTQVDNLEARAIESMLYNSTAVHFAPDSEYQIDQNAVYTSLGSYEQMPADVKFDIIEELVCASQVGTTKDYTINVYKSASKPVAGNRPSVNFTLLKSLTKSFNSVLELKSIDLGEVLTVSRNEWLTIIIATIANNNPRMAYFSSNPNSDRLELLYMNSSDMSEQIGIWSGHYQTPFKLKLKSNFVLKSEAASAYLAKVDNLESLTDKPAALETLGGASQTQVDELNNRSLDSYTAEAITVYRDLDSEYLPDTFLIATTVATYKKMPSNKKLSRVRVNFSAHYGSADYTIHLYKSSSMPVSGNIPSQDFTLLGTVVKNINSTLELKGLDLGIVCSVNKDEWLIAFASTTVNVNPKIACFSTNGDGTRHGVIQIDGSSSMDSPILVLDNIFVAAFELELDSAFALKQNPRITLPNILYATVGVEFNLYYDTLVLSQDRGLLSPLNCQVEVICAKGRSLERRYSYTPVLADVGSRNLTVNVYDNNKVLLETRTVTLTVIAAAAPSAIKNICMIGDSLTDAGVITTTLRNNFVALGSNTPVFWGLRGSGANKHEGHQGWGFISFATSNAGTNPLWNGSGLDIANYRTTLNMGLTKFDLVTIHLGINDNFDIVADQSRIDEQIGYAKSIIDAFLADNATTKIIIQLPSTDCNTKNSYGADGQYGATRSKEQFQKNMWLLRESIISEFDNGAYNANISVGIAGLVIDRYYGYPFENRAISGRVATTESVHSNTLHPDTSGYQQMGDGIYPHVLKILQL